MWIVPSRNRPHLIAKMFNAAPPTTPGIIAIDDDQVEMYRDVPLPKDWSLDVSPRQNFVPKNNEIFARYSTLPWYGTMNDDQVPLTPGWDTRLVAAAGRWKIAWCEDGLRHRATCVALGGDFVRACGFLFVPVMKHFYGDDGHELMSQELGTRVVLKDVIVEHRHYSNKKNPAPRDATYAERPKQAEDEVKYRAWVKICWPPLREKLLALKHDG